MYLKNYVLGPLRAGPSEDTDFSHYHHLERWRQSMADLYVFIPNKHLMYIDIYKYLYMYLINIYIHLTYSSYISHNTIYDERRQGRHCTWSARH